MKKILVTRKLLEINEKRISKLWNVNLNLFKHQMLNWHKKIMKMVMDKFNLSTYDMAIFAYFDGILTAVIIYEFIL